MSPHHDSLLDNALSMILVLTLVFGLLGAYLWRDRKWRR